MTVKERHVAGRILFLRRAFTVPPLARGCSLAVRSDSDCRRAWLSKSAAVGSNPRTCSSVGSRHAHFGCGDGERDLLACGDDTRADDEPAGERAGEVRRAGADPCVFDDC